MNIYYLTSLFSFIQNAIAYVDIKGELTFDLYPINWGALENVRGSKVVIENEKLHNKARASKETATARYTTAKKTAKTPARDDCVYQLPNTTQIEALLSDMMNQLTKIFVRAHDYMSRRGARRNTKRFKIVRQKMDSNFFEEAYNLMRKEYRQAMNTTADTWRASVHDPCHHQGRVKAMWRALLDRSKAILQRAAVRCVRDFLRVRHRADDTTTKENLAQLLLREIREVRSNQLKVLCDNFNLCYKDLLS